MGSDVAIEGRGIMIEATFAITVGVRVKLGTFCGQGVSGTVFWPSVTR